MNNKSLIVFYSQTGVTKSIAEMVQEKTGGNLYEVKTQRTYDSDMWKAWDEAQKETASGRLPELAGQLPDLGRYDFIILGGPVWGWTISNPLLAYIRQTDFTGKKVSAFWTFYDHDEKYAEDVRNECKGAIVETGLSIPRSAMNDHESLSNKIDDWLKSITLL